jgi:hypothetical protein
MKSHIRLMTINGGHYHGLYIGDRLYLIGYLGQVSSRIRP